MRSKVTLVVLVLTVALVSIASAQQRNKTDVWMGILARDIDKKKATVMKVEEGVGVFVAFTVPFGPADKQGVRIGDVILKAEDNKITSTSELKDILSAHQPGDIINITVLREGKNIDIDLKLKKKNTSAAQSISNNKNAEVL